jgi:antitoxin PrlF
VLNVVRATGTDPLRLVCTLPPTAGRRQRRFRRVPYIGRGPRPRDRPVARSASPHQQLVLGPQQLNSVTGTDPPTRLPASAASPGSRTSTGTAMARRRAAWHDDPMDATRVLGQQGRLVIPAEIRSALGLAPGDRLHVRLVGRRVVLERQEDAVAELRGLASAVPEERSLVDELLAERRLAASSSE